MEFSVPYLEAMRAKAPRMFNELRRSGKMAEHVQAKTAEAHRMVRELLKDEPKLPSGAPKNLAAQRQAEQTVMTTLIDFPPESQTKPDDPLAAAPTPA